MQYLNVYSKQDILSRTRIRKFETKVGERVLAAADPGALAASIEKSVAEYVLVGVPEDIGARANGSQGGASTTWQPFIDCFLNIQSNDFLEGENILVLGHFDFSEMQRLIETNAHGQDEKQEAYRHAVHTIDEAVEDLVRIITAFGKIPIVIG